MSPLGCLLPAVLAACCLPVVVQGQDSVLSQFSAAELQCFSVKKVLYPGDNTCYKMLHRGPCQHGEWLVLDKDEAEHGTPVPVCRSRPCITTSFSVLWPADGNCYNARTHGKTLCPLDGTVLMTDMFGEGHCPCMKEPPHIRMADDPEGSCYPVQQRGPCPGERDYVVPDDSTENKDLGKCVRNMCSAATISKGVPHVLYQPHRKCYSLNDMGPCPPTATLMISELTLKPECMSPVLSSIDIGAMCRIDMMTGKCIEEVQAAAQNTVNLAQEMDKAVCKPSRSMKKNKQCNLKKPQATTL